ncbi:MAG: dockerin type I domain-containing protein, partial [Bacteroidota bacterium]
GQYQFTQAPSGTYTLQTTTNRTWGGVNSTDALNVARHFSNTQLLSGIRINAADVNASNSINATDALQISRRTVSQITSFAAGNWFFQSPTVTLSGGVLQQSAIKGICIGDVNGSFNPGARTMPGVAFDSRLETSSTLPSGMLAIVAPESMHLGAVTLHISIPTHLGAARFSSDLLGGNLIWNQEQGVLHISWYDLEGVRVSAGSTLGYISFENALKQGDFSSIQLTENSELADLQAEPIQNAMLRLAGNADLAHFSAVVYPNPSRGASTIAVSMAQDADVRYVLTDLMGRTITSSDWTALAAGKHNLSIDMPSAGQYLLNIENRSTAGSESKTLRITRLP